MKRRQFLHLLKYSSLSLLLPHFARGSDLSPTKQPLIMLDKIMLTPNPDIIVPIKISDNEWQQHLTPEQYNILRKHGTERAFTSKLNDEKRQGEYVCAGCGLALFKSEYKYNSGTGWPSFFNTIKNRIETSIDFKLIYPRTEYHCARCKGHQGHVFKDGPEPTKLRYCNNGVALKFIASDI